MKFYSPFLQVYTLRRFSMEEKIIEINLSGFCRTCNSMQTVTCEYIPTESGRKLDVMNCAHKTCRHHAACAIYREAHENEQI